MLQKTKSFLFFHNLSKFEKKRNENNFEFFPFVNLDTLPKMSSCPS
jgi:hypothetical protein